MTTVRIYAEGWIFGDGQLPVLSVGDVVPNIGIQAFGSLVEESSGIDAIARTPDQPSNEQETYVLDGVLVWRSETIDGGIVAVNGALVLLRSASQFDGNWFVSQKLDLPEVGDRLRITVGFSLMAEHDLRLAPDESDFRRWGLVDGPNVRSTWRVTAIDAQRSLPELEEFSSAPTFVTSVERVETMDIGAPNTIHILELEPIRDI